MTDSGPITERRSWNWLKHVRFTIVAGILLAVGLKACHRYYYPYGYTHSCSKGLGTALRVWAENHQEWLPHGGRTPEASLGLIVSDSPAYALWVLGGKNIPSAVFQHALTNSGAFGPETCGWHYVEGLRESDNLDLAVAWDKTEGLNHNGRRISGLMHEVVMLAGNIDFVSKSRWPEFIANQRKLLDEVIASRSPGDPPILWSDEASLGLNRFPAAVRPQIPADTSPPLSSPSARAK